MRLPKETSERIKIGYGRIGGVNSADAVQGEMLLLTEDVRTTLVTALRVAANQYRDDIKTAREAGVPRLVEQFAIQAREAMALADDLER